MKLRAVLNKRREVLELSGDAITLSHCRQAVQRKFGLRENSFNLSLNGKDILENDSVLLRDLGIVNGDLIHVLLNNDEEEITSDNLSAPGSSRSTVHSTPTPSFHSTEPVAGPSQVRSVLSAHGKQHDEQSKEKTREAGTENVQHRPGSFSSVSSAGSVSSVRSLVLCREGIPPMLEDLYRATGVGTIHQAAWVVIRVLMLETGFICGLEEPTDMGKVEKLNRDEPSKAWKTGGVVKVMYTHSSCPGLTCSLTSTSLGPYMMLHGHTNSVAKSDIYQCKLQPTDFVRGNVDLKTSGALSVYYNLHRLSRLFKDQVAYPLLSFMRAALGLPQLCGFMAVPAEVKLMILGNLPVQSIINVSCACRELRSLSSESTLWQHLVLRDFDANVKEQTRSWKATYIHLYKQRKTQEQMRMQVMVPPHGIYPSDYGLGAQRYRGDTFPPGIIGGHRDLFPNLPFMPGGINPTPGISPGTGFPRPRFDPFGPLPDINQNPGPSRRGRHPDRHFNPSRGFPPGFL